MHERITYVCESNTLTFVFWKLSVLDKTNVNAIDKKHDT